MKALASFVMKGWPQATGVAVLCALLSPVLAPLSLVSGAVVALVTLRNGLVAGLQVAGAAGLVGTPYDSGGSVREQGISKAGNKRTRRLMVEVSWYWLRYQPGSAITEWFNKRFAQGGKRMRRIGIVGVARRLLIALWKYARFGEVPEGARFKEAEKAAA